MIIKFNDPFKTNVASEFSVKKDSIVNGHGDLKRVLSSANEAIIYVSSKPGKENVNFTAQSAEAWNLLLKDGEYTVKI